MHNHLSPWEVFFRKSVIKTFVPGAFLLDIRGSLRVDKGSIIDQERAWIKPLLTGMTYHMIDSVDTYHPDIVGDVMVMPVLDASYDVITCLSVLEHVSRPWDAMKEMYRVLKPEGSLILYVPFLFPYCETAENDKDYFRFSEVAMRSLCEPFHSVEFCSVRGRMETICHFFPNAIDRFLAPMARWFDSRYPGSGKQVSGFFVHAIK